MRTIDQLRRLAMGTPEHPAILQDALRDALYLLNEEERWHEYYEHLLAESEETCEKLRDQVAEVAQLRKAGGRLARCLKVLVRYDTERGLNRSSERDALKEWQAALHPQDGEE